MTYRAKSADDNDVTLTKMVFAFVIVCAWKGADSVTTINCSDTPSLRLDKDDFTQLEVEDMEHVVISRDAVTSPDNVTDPQCKSRRNSSEVTFTFSSPFECDPFVEASGGALYVTWLVRNVPGADANETCFNRTCLFDLTYLVNSSAVATGISFRSDARAPLLMEKRRGRSGRRRRDGAFSKVLARSKRALWKVVGNARSAKGAFSLNIGFFDNSFMTEQTSVAMPGFICVEVSLSDEDRESNTRLFVQVTNCWANNAEDSGAEPQYDVIEENCKASDNVIIEQNFALSFARFKFRSFFFSNSNITETQKIFVHCDVRICDQVVQSACDADNCTARRRRDVTNIASAFEKPTRRQGSYRMTRGPIFVLPRTIDRCQHDNGGCSDVCSMIGDDVICSCASGKTLESDGKTCLDVEVYLREEEVGGDIITMAVVISILFTLLAAASILQRIFQ